jgi:hypothetical protein
MIVYCIAFIFHVYSYLIRMAKGEKDLVLFERLH